MKSVIFALFFPLLLSVCALGQAPSSTQSDAVKPTSDQAPKRQIFRATKEQIIQVQTMLKSKGMYGGDASGKLDDATRESIKTYQKGNGLRETGTLNRATLEKMGVELTDRQKLIPVSPNSYASADSPKATNSESKPRGPIFRATKDQIVEAQKMLKSKGIYSGDESGKLDDATRAALKKYQEANGVKVTGTLNQATLEKMGIPLTDKQKGDSTEGSK
jgi:peptidoglycan hydrolase-like protein with peptidoglycan-binding domain